MWMAMCPWSRCISIVDSPLSVPGSGLPCEAPGEFSTWGACLPLAMTQGRPGAPGHSWLPGWPMLLLGTSKGPSVASAADSFGGVFLPRGGVQRAASAGCSPAVRQQWRLGGSTPPNWCWGAGLPIVRKFPIKTFSNQKFSQFFSSNKESFPIKNCPRKPTLPWQTTWATQNLSALAWAQVAMASDQARCAKWCSASPWSAETLCARCMPLSITSCAHSINAATRLLHWLHNNAKGHETPNLLVHHTL